MNLRPLILAAAAFCAACSHQPSPVPMPEAAATAATAPLRLASYNTSLYTERSGGLIEDLRAGSAQARAIAERLPPAMD